MDAFADERDHAVLEQDPYTFSVLRRIIDTPCALLLSDHRRLILCFTGPPMPVWIWTPDDAAGEEMENAYRLAARQGFLDGGYRLNMKYALAAFFIRRAAADSKALSVMTNMLAYDCPDPVEPASPADGSLYRCGEGNLAELVDILEKFHEEIGIDQKDRDGYRADAKAFIGTGRMFFWKNAQGQTVASCKYAPVGGLASVNLVYTHPAFRRKHYAQNLVYQVTKLARQEGLLPMLYTDADYAASNACYRGIGYRPRGKLCTIGCKSPL